MGCNCEPKKYSVSMGCCQPVLGPIEAYYTKYQIDKMLEEIESGITSGCCITPEEVDEKIDEAISGISPDLSDYYTKEEVDALIPEVPSLSGYATEQWVEDKHYITGVDLSDYATKEEIPTVPTSNTAFTNDAGYLTEHQHLKTINGQSLVGDGDIEITTGGTIDLSNYYTTAQTVNLVESAVTRVEGEMPTVPTSNTAFTNDAGYLTEHQSLSGYATEQWVEDKHYITGVDLSDYALKSEIPTVPTSNTAFTNDAGYLTEHQSLSAYSTTNEVNTLINQSISGKQDTLSAGTNITIVDNVISATGGGGTSYTPSSGISITNNEISTRIGNGLRYTQDGTLEVNSTNAIASGNTQVPLSYVVYNYIKNNCMMKAQIWCGTQAEYNAIGTKDNNVIYLIHA
jgi:hypothetical protein